MTLDDAISTSTRWVAWRIGKVGWSAWHRIDFDHSGNNGKLCWTLCGRDFAEHKVTSFSEDPAEGQGRCLVCIHEHEVGLSRSKHAPEP